MALTSNSIAVVGASGFIGGAIVRAAKKAGISVKEISAPRIEPIAGQAVESEVSRQLTAFSQRQSEPLFSLHGVHSVINAAGLARPDSSDAHALNGANAVLPCLIAAAANRAGASQFIHVSSAAVQGSRDPLDESPGQEPFSPYSTSKALGEQLLLQNKDLWKISLTIHRPTSVLDESRGISRSLMKIARKRFVPLLGDGQVPLPVCLLENVAECLLFLTKASPTPAITLQPWEGMTTRSLMECFAEDPTFVSVPLFAWKGLIRGVGIASPAASRRIELYAFGQGQKAETLAAMGFIPPAMEMEKYRTLARKTLKYLADKGA